ncbi:type IV secretion system protein, partial [Salipiger bermudensis]
MGHLLLRTALATTLGVGLHLGALSPVLAQGVPVVDTQNIAQNIQQLRQMIEDEILQNEQLTQLREQLGLLTDQLAELQRTYEALTRLA